MDPLITVRIIETGEYTVTDVGYSTAVGAEACGPRTYTLKESGSAPDWVALTSPATPSVVGT